jgi:hypothetical protein
MRGHAIAAMCHGARPGQNGLNIRGAALQSAAAVLGVALYEVRVVSIVQQFEQNDEVR